MRRVLLLCGLAMSLSSGIVYTAIAPATVVEAQDDLASKAARRAATMYEEQAQTCAKEAYELNPKMQKFRVIQAEDPFNMLVMKIWTDMKEDYRKTCFWYHAYSELAQKSRANITEPTPTPSPITSAASPDPRDPSRTPSPSGTGTLPIWPREENDLHAKFMTDQKRKLRELKERADKLIKEANDLLNKARSTKAKTPQPGYKTEFDSTDGLIIVKFSTPHGILRVNLPDDIRPGDTISGSLVAEPNGQIKTERAGNRAALNQYQVMIANSRPGANDFILKLFRKKPPATKPETGSNLDRSEPCACPFEFTFSGSGGFVTIEQPQTAPVTAQPSACVEGCPAFLAYGSVLDNISGDATTMEAQYLKPLTEAQIDQLYDMKDTEQPPAEPKPNQFRLPTTGQNGSSVEIKGPFDGNLRTTDIKIGGQPVVKLAESPRSCIFKSPEQNFGLTEITVKEGHVEQKGHYRNVGVSLKADTTFLQTGQRTIVTIDVSGLQNIKEDRPLHLEASGVINMDGGNYQYLSIRPQDVKPEDDILLRARSRVSKPAASASRRPSFNEHISFRLRRTPP